MAVLLALAVPGATFLASWTSQRKSLSKEYLISVESRVSRLELDLKNCEADLRACCKERSRLTMENFKLMRDLLKVTSLCQSHGVNFNPLDSQVEGIL